MWQMIAMGVLSGLSSFGSNKAMKAQYKAAQKTAEINAKLAEANFNRRSAYRNEELGQQVWNIAQQGQELMGVQRASMAASGFDTSTGDQRILTDTLTRNLAKQSGVNRTYYLQQFEDELQTNNDIMQYNFEAYSNRMMAKQYSGARSASKIGLAAGTAALGAYSPNPGKKGGISSNTGANLNWMSQGTSFAQQAGKTGFGKLSLYNTSSFNSGVKF